MPNQTTTRPIIGVLGAHFPRSSGVNIAGMSESYLAAIEAAGGIPLLIHLTNDEVVLDTHYRHCAGLLFAGGDDIDPQHYGQPRHPRLGVIEPLRDTVELALARRAAADKKPVLGICRGVQLLNVAFGGTLYQDIPSELPDALDHRASSLAGQRTLLAHPLQLDANSWLAEQLGTTEIAANSLHHQALQQVAPGLRVVGRAPDGVVEAVEGSGQQFVVGVQCHPENLWNSSEPRWARLFDAFVAAVPGAGER